MCKYLLIFSVLLLFPLGDTKSKKRISDKNFRYEFYTTDKTADTSPDRYYYWFKGGAIHNTEYGFSGELLHDSFSKYYHSNQLAETGQFDRGLKEGIWKTWFDTGVLESKIYWNDGQRDGSYEMYNPIGKLIEKGGYRNNKKHGFWINYQRKDTLKFKNGKAVVYKITRKVPPAIDSTATDTVAKPGFLKRLFGKKQKDTVSAVTDTASNNSPGFLKRVFSGKKSKNKNNTSDGQGS